MGAPIGSQPRASCQRSKWGPRADCGRAPAVNGTPQGRSRAGRFAAAGRARRWPRSLFSESRPVPMEPRVTHRRVASIARAACALSLPTFSPSHASQVQEWTALACSPRRFAPPRPLKSASFQGPAPRRHEPSSGSRAGWVGNSWTALQRLRALKPPRASGAPRHSSATRSWAWHRRRCAAACRLASSRSCPRRCRASS